jgi:hypothetical protein
MSEFDVGFSLVNDVIGNLQNLEQNPHHYASWLARFGGKAVWTNSFLWLDGPLQINSTIYIPMLMNQPLPLFYLYTSVANAQGNQGSTKVDNDFLEYSVKRENLR